MTDRNVSNNCREDALGGTACVWVDEENQILRQKIIGAVHRETSTWLAERSRVLAQQLPDPSNVRILIEASQGGKADADARRDFGRSLRRSEIRKVAFCQTNPLVRLVIRFVRTGSGSRKIRAFSSEREALKWLLAQ
jgi:hypothetical protein